MISGFDRIRSVTHHLYEVKRILVKFHPVECPRYLSQLPGTVLSTPLNHILYGLGRGLCPVAF